MIRNSLGCNVVEAAERRVLDCFNKNEVVCLSFSGGKDSICTASVVFKTMQKYHIPFSRLFVIFVDEEAIYPDIEQIVMLWRSRFMAAGSKFYWFCMPFKHYNCCNRLADDESFILWEPGKEDRDFELNKDYKQMFKDAMKDAVKHPDDYPGYDKVKKTYSNMYDWMSKTVWRLAYQILIAGDPKSRTHRALILQINIEKTEHGKANAEAVK